MPLSLSSASIDRPRRGGALGAAVVAGSVVWGGALVMAGTALLTMGGGAGWLLIGLSAVVGGNWVFMKGASNRVFVGRVVDLAEKLLGAAVGLAALGWVVVLLAGGSW